MKLFVNSKIRNITLAIGLVQFLVMIFTPGLEWSSDPKDYTFWKAFFSVIINIVFLNLCFVFFSKKEEKSN
jgi:hypothetical protein